MTTTETSAGTGLRSRWRRTPVRVRLTVLLALVTVGALVLSGITAYLLNRAAMYERIDEALHRTVTEIQMLAEDGVVPETGQPISSANELIRVAMLRTLPVENEGILGLKDGRATLGANSAVKLRLEDDPQLVAWAAEQTGGRAVRLETTQTDTTEYRAAVVPVGGPEQEDRGALLVAFDLDAERAELNRNFAGYFVAAALSVLIALLLGWFVLRRAFEPLETLGSTVRGISEADLDDRVDVRGEDDVAALGHHVNAMLDRLQDSFASQRQLIDDVGHELRTPITIVQGNLEVMDADDPRDVRESTDVCFDELARMRRLVDDLVLLAKSARPDFVQPELVDVEDLTHTVFGKAAQLGERDWGLDAVARTTASLDAQRITQAWLQLVSNAVRYSEPGTAVHLGSSVVESSLRLWVRDEGVGVAPEDRERIFERFSRGSTVCRTDGSGLGLTIVAAIAEAHGGTVDLQSVPGMGSLFSVTVPLHRTPPLPTDDEED